ncbi:MAG: TRAP transporter small permease subunit [Acidimicrobiia bacterium]|nr:TRAP transporter small permease subunit [Acidimicrobiia bacterium]
MTMGVATTPRRVGPLGRALGAYTRAVDRLSEGLGWMAKWIVPICVVVGFLNVLLRYIGRFQNRALTSNRYVELQWMLFGAIFLLVLPYILKRSINVRVDFLQTRFSRKVQALIDFVGHVLGLIPFCLLALWANWDYALISLFQRGERWGTWQVWEVWEKSPDARGLPRAPIKLLVILAFFCLLLQAVAELVKLAFVMTEREAVAAPEEPPDAPLRVE